MKMVVVIATHRREALLARTLASLANCGQPEEFHCTLVVENGERGGAERVVEQGPAMLKARYLFEPAGSKSRALNHAVAQIDEGLAVFLDDDVRVSPNLLKSYAVSAREAGSGAFFGGPVEPDYEDTPPDWLIKFLPFSARGWHLDDPSQPIAKPTFLGFNWAAFAGDLRRVGGFDERLGPGSAAGLGDESDIQRRLVASGLRAKYVPEALVHHWVPRNRCSPDWVLERARRYGIGSGLLTDERAMGFTVAGYPLALVKRTVKSWLRLQLRRSADRRERFEAELKYHRLRGVLRGALLKHQPSDQGRTV